MGKKEYEASKRVVEAKRAVEEHAGEQPGAYQSEYGGALREAMDKLMTQQEFQYRLDGDALYRRYRDSAVKNGRLAMQDTLGQAAALTGGYGSSYAQSVGQQAYDKELDALGDRIPELYTLAMEQYKLRNQGLREKYDLLLGAENQNYSRYTDSLNAWQQEADRLMEQYRAEREADYNAYRDDVADWKWQEEYDESKRRYDQQWEAEHPAAAPLPRYTGGGGSQRSTKKDRQSSTKSPSLVGAVLGALGALSQTAKKKKGA